MLENLQTLELNSTTIENIPNAGKLLSSLRHLDYSNTSAICDIVDNCIDANADFIRINLIAEGKTDIKRIEIYDNGVGMDKATLHQAMKLGSDTDKNPQYDLGRYGMGLVTASISIGEKLEVTSLHDDVVYYACQDLAYIRETNSFSITLDEYNVEKAAKFKEKLKQNTADSNCSGTLVAIENIDRWQWTRLSASEKHLTETLGQIFRKFIKSGKSIYINDVKVEAIDPIYDHENTLLAEDSIEVNGEKIFIKLFELKDYGQSINKDKGFNIQNQGFYVLRNNREISTGLTFNLWTKHNDMNLFRAEFSYSGALDDIMSAGFTKQHINPEANQSLHDKLKSLVIPHLKQIRTRVKKRQVDNRDKKEDFTDAEKYITQKAHLLKAPKAISQQRDPKKDRGQTSSAQPKQIGSPQLDITKKKRIDLSAHKVSFRTKSMDKAGPLFTTEMEKDVTVIYWNVDHAFYADFIIPHEGDKEILNPICFLIYSLASAELRSKVDSDSEVILDNIKADLSQNLRVLMNS